MANKKIIYLLIVCLVLGGSLGFAYRDDITRAMTKLTLDRTLQGGGTRVVDYSNDKKLIGASHNVFVGRVMRQSGDKKRKNGPPETQFTVEVITNIKGNLKGSVVVNQFGTGYWGEVLYSAGSFAPKRAKVEDILLQPGWTYIFAARFNEDEGWYTVSAPPYDSIVIGKDSNIDAAALRQSAEANGNVRALKKAFAQEELLDADVTHGHTWNSYASRHYNANGELIDDTVELAKQHANANAAPSSAPASESASPSASFEPTTSPTLTPAESVSPSPIEEPSAPTPSPTEVPVQS